MTRIALLPSSYPPSLGGVEELTRHLKGDAEMSCFDFGLQFLDTEKMTYWGKCRDAGFWIENASIEWNEEQTPFHTVARLTLMPKSQLTAEASEAVYFDVTGNSTPDSTPLGSINRARWPAEVASRKARTRKGGGAQPQSHPPVSDLEAQRLP